MLQSGESSKFLGLLSFLVPTQCRKGNQDLCSLTLFWTTPNLKDSAIIEEAEMAPVKLSPLNDTNNMRKIYLLLLSLYVLWMPINTCDCTQPIIAKSKLTTYLPINSQPMAGCTVMAANTPAYPQNKSRFNPHQWQNSFFWLVHLGSCHQTESETISQSGGAPGSLLAPGVVSLQHRPGKSTGHIHMMPKNQQKLKINFFHVICFNYYYYFCTLGREGV